MTRVLGRGLFVVVCPLILGHCVSEAAAPREVSQAGGAPSSGGASAGGSSPRVNGVVGATGGSQLSNSGGGGPLASMGGRPTVPSGGTTSATTGGSSPSLQGGSAGATGTQMNPDGSLTPKSTFSLFNGVDLTGWSADVPDKETDPTLPDSFIVKNGLLVSQGTAIGHLLTDATYRDYRLEVEYRFSAGEGNCGVLIHASELRALYGAFPKSIEVQLFSGDAGDFWCIQENIEVPNMDARRPHDPGQAYGGGEADARRILNLTDDSEKPVGEWNTIVIEARARGITVWMNGELVNDGFNCTADHGKIALQAEGAEVEFRRVEIGPLSATP